VKKTPLTRKTPLQPGEALERKAAWGTPAPVFPMFRRNQAARHHQQKRRPASSPGVPVKVRAALAVRSEGMCEIAAPGCTGAAVDPSHRISTGMGGRKREAAAHHHVLSNLIHACRWCHQERLHAQPALAYWAGWMLRENENPREVPVSYRGQRRWLTDDGRVLTDSPITPEEAQ
jgi:hypothetical protein